MFAVGALHAFNQAAACDAYRAAHEKLLKEASTLAPLERLQTLLLLTMFTSFSDEPSLRAESIPLQGRLAAVSILATTGIEMLKEFRNCVTVHAMFRHVSVRLGMCG